ncbi:hypothetical protein BN14_09299 [Rhizoctonia solani AG-1 IB]|nr:hypothetical protein BN14_09299 [Rhizoctonia solani AG-1 IB]
MRGDVPGQKAIRESLVTLERQLVESTSFDAAQNLIDNEVSTLNQIASNGMYASAAGKGLTHVQYLKTYWMTQALWESWSDHARVSAAALIGIAINRVVMTNNHLESFNGLLKQKLLKGYARGGRRIRVDILVFMLATKVAQSIFQRRKLEEEERNMLRKALEGVPGVVSLLGNNANRAIEAPVAYLSPDKTRDNEAQLLLQQNRLSHPTIHGGGIQLTCWSTQSVDAQGAPIGYNIWLGFNGIALCICPDFQRRGGACKHMRAALLQVQAIKLWARQYQIDNPIVYAPEIELPVSKNAAIRMIAAQYRSDGRIAAHREAASVRSNAGEPAGDMFAQATRHVNEALQGDFLGSLNDVEGEECESDSTADDIDTEEETELSGDDLALWPNDDEVRLNNTFNWPALTSPFWVLQFPSNSAQGFAEQVTARTTYDIKRHLKLLPDIHAGLDHITRRALGSSLHRSTYEQYANELEATAARIRGLLSHSASVPASQPRTQTPAPTQHSTRATLLPPSPERRQYRKNSRSFH